MNGKKMSENCIECGRNTQFGSGLFVNRIPADDAWLCPECQSLECDRCGEKTMDYTFFSREIRCQNCASPDWVIVNWFDTDEGQYMFWNQDIGWVSLESASIYLNKDLLGLALPLEGAWVMKSFVNRLIANIGGYENE
jgi:DNA-directed RNA polymerase subunit RPC12/RpoP